MVTRKNIMLRSSLADTLKKKKRIKKLNKISRRWKRVTRVRKVETGKGILAYEYYLK